MGGHDILVQGVFFTIAFVSYNYWIFELVDTILEEPRLKRPQRLILGVFNTALVFVIATLPYISSSLAYGFVLGVLFIEFWLFYKDTALRALFVALSCGIHIMAMRAACSSILSLITGLPVYTLANNAVWLLVTLSMTFFLLDGCIWLVIRFVPAKSIKIVNQHKEQLLFMTVWLVIANLYFVFNAKLYGSEALMTFIIHNQMAVSAFVLCAVYVVLFFAFKTGQLLNYKEKNDELLQAVETEQHFRESVTNDAISTYEVILSRDILESGLGEVEEIIRQHNRRYSKVIPIVVASLVHPDDRARVLSYISRESLLKDYQAGKVEREVEYRRRKADGTYFWVKTVVNLYEDKATGYIKGFAYIKDVNDEKLSELDLKNKAERDMLTRLYNKGTTENLITSFLSQKRDVPCCGALFIIDMDDFKLVNDRLGHKFGDTVLHDLSHKLKLVFRGAGNDNREGEDIVGRIGGDEFMVFIKYVEDMKVLKSKAEQISKVFDHVYETNEGEPIAISCSIGIAIMPQHGTTFEELYKSADIALYQSKNRGKDVFTFYNGEEFVGYESQRGMIESD